MDKKKKIIIISCVAFVLIVAAAIAANVLGLLSGPIQKQAVGLYPAYVVKDGKQLWGLIDQNGKMVVDPAYDAIEDYNDYGYAKFTKNKKYGILDKNGKEFLKPEYDDITGIDQVSGYIVAKKGNDNTVYNAGMRKVYQEEKVLVKGFKNDISAITSMESRIQKDTKIGYIDKNFKVFIQPQFKTGEDFINNKAAVTDKDGKYMIIDINGNTISKFDYEVVYNGNDIMGYKDLSKNKVGFVRTNGEKVSEAIYFSLGGFEGDRCIVNTDKDKSGLVDASGKYYIPAEYYKIKFIGDGLYLAWMNSPEYNENKYPEQLRKGAIFTSDGAQLTDFIIRDAGKSKDGIIWVSESDKTYFVDSKAQKITSLPQFEGKCSLKYFNDGNFIRVITSDRLYYSNKEGKIIWDSNAEVNLGDKGSIYSKFISEDIFTVIYPYVKLVNASEEQIINDKIRKIFIDDNSSKRDVKKQFKRSYTYSFSGSVLSITVTDTSVVIADSKSSESSSKIVHLNVNTGKEYIFEDLFKKDSNYVSTLTSISQKGFDENNNTKDMPKLKKPVFHPNQKFTVDKEAVIVYFDPNEVYEKPSPNEPKFPIYFSDIPDYIDKQGEFWKALAF